MGSRLKKVYYGLAGQINKLSGSNDLFVAASFFNNHRNAVHTILRHRLYLKERFDKMKKLYLPAGTFAAGLINGLLGTGGGMIALPTLIKSGVPRKKAHATTIMMIFTFSLISSAMYIYTKRVTISDALPYIPAGILGAIFGAWLLKKMPDRILRKLFGAFMIWAGIKLLMP